MKWRIARIILIAALIFQFQIFGWLENRTPVKAISNTADVTVSVAIEYGGVLPPSSFTVTRITDTEVLIEWVPAENAENTLIRMKVNSLPEDVSDGYLVYSGNASSFTDEWLDLDVMWSEVYYIAVSENATGGLSETYIYDYTESPYVEEIANNLSALEFLSMAASALVYLIPLLVVSILAFWKENYFMFILACIISVMTGFYAPDILSGEYSTTPLGVTVGLSLILYSLICAGWALNLIFKSLREREEI